MSYKKFFSATALAMLLSVSNTAFSDSVNTIEEDDEETSVYFSMHGGVGWGKISDLKVNSGDSTQKLSSIKGFKDNNLVEYKPDYKLSLDGGVSVGYRMGNIRVELEGLYSHLNIDSKDESKYLYYDDHTSFTGERKAVSDAQKELDKENEATGKIADKTAAFGNAISALNKKIKETKIENKGFSTAALMVNGYYDIDLGEDFPVGAYASVGFGGAKVAFLESTDTGFMDNIKFAFQGRVGASYAFSPAVKLYGGMRYFGVLDDEFKNIKYSSAEKNAGQPAQQSTKNALNVKNSYGVFNLEVGLMFNF